MSAPTIPQETETAPEVASAVPGGSSAKTWSVGTLTYTTGGLILLVVLLLAGDFAWSMRERSVFPLFQVLLRKYEASDLLSSLLLGSIPACLTVLIWPVVSVWSDRTRSRWGRRIPFLFLPTPLVAGAMVGLAYSPQIGVWLQQLLGGTGNPKLYILTVFGLFWILFEVFAMVTNSVFYGLVNDTVPRVLIGRFYALFRMASLGAGVYFNYSLIGYAETHAKEVFLAIAAFYLVGFSLMCRFVKEGTYPPPPPVVQNDTFFAKIGRYFRECGHHRFYRLTFVTLSLASLAPVAVNLFSLYAAKSYGIETDKYGKYLALSYICSFVISFPLGWLADRYHPMRVASTCMAIYALTMVAGFFWVHDASTFAVFFIAHTVLSGCYGTASMGLYPMVFPQAQFGQFFSAYSLLFNFLVFGASPVLGYVLDLSGNWYLLVFAISGGVGVATVVLWGFWYRQFKAGGGVKGFVPPAPLEARE